MGARIFITYSDLPRINGYVGTTTQALAHRCQDKFICFGGAAGGGKTVFGCNEAILHALRYPGAVVAIGRLEKTSLLRSTVVTLNRWLPTSEVKSQNKEGVRFKNGSQVIFLSLGDDRKNLDRIRGLELSMFFIDDGSEVSYDVWGLLCSRLRLALPGVYYKGIISSNPSPSWIRTEFLTSPKPNYRFIQSLPTDNPHLPDGYIEEMKDHLPQHLWDVYFSGQWNEWAIDNDLFPSDLVAAALERKIERVGPVSWGIDVARKGSCSTVVARKVGNLYEVVAEIPGGGDFIGQAAQVEAILNDERAFGHVDCSGVGGGLLDFLHASGHRNLQEHLGSAGPLNARYKNRRAEVYWDFRSTLYQSRLPNDKALLTQMHMRYQVVNGKLAVETKEDLARRNANTDKLDALVLSAIGTDRNVTWASPKTNGPDRRSNEAIMSEFMTGMGCNRIIRR